MDSVSTNFDNKTVRFKVDYYILYTVLLVLILLFIISIICYQYQKHSSKLKQAYYRTKNIKIENNEFKNVTIKTQTCCYFDDIIKIDNIDFDNILLDKNSFDNILVHDISYKTLIDPEPLRIRFDKVDWFVRVYDGTRYFTLFGTEKYDVIYNKIICLIEVKSGIIRDIPHNYIIIKFDSYDSLSIEKK